MSNHQNGFYEDENIVLSPIEIKDRILNEKNIPITKEFINNIFKNLNFNHKVQNLQNFQNAMIHVSYLEENLVNPKTIKLLKDVTPINPSLRKSCMPLQTRSYERLEFLGDSILRHAIGKYLFKRYEHEEEGFLTTNRSKMENKFALSELARKFGMQNYAIIARNIEEINGRSTYVTLTEDIFEAFIGALNLEIGDDRCVEFIWKIIESELDMAETIRTQTNYKDTLMQYYHKFDVKRRDLAYDDTEIEVNGKKRYKTTVKDKETNAPLGDGSGKSKKSSQQRAAKDALIKLGLLGNEEEDEEYFEYSGDLEKEISKTKKSI